MNNPSERIVSTRDIFFSWLPLAASWLFMGLELPLVSFVMARMADPKIHLAAYGGVVFPLALIIEAPIIMLLAASTSLSKDEASYHKLMKFMMWAGGGLTLLHILLAFTPLYDLIVVRLLNPPAEIIEPARIGLMIMTPWTWTIAYRRFQQGVLIRYGHSISVSIGTAIRLLANMLVLSLGLFIEGITGIVIATSAIAAGVTAEAIYAGWRVQPVIKGELPKITPTTPILTWHYFAKFYIPLALTSLLNLILQPMGSAAMARMPMPLESLALWPVMGGFLFIFRSLGFAYNEVVISWMDRPGSYKSLVKFHWYLSIFLILVMSLITFTPLGNFWFRDVANLEPAMVDLAMSVLWIGALWPIVSVPQNFLQGVIVFGKRTNGLTESVFVLMGVTFAILFAGSLFGHFTGIYVTLGAFVAATFAQTLWLLYRALPVLQSASLRDSTQFTN